jgi:hypothetical protein
VVSGSTGFHVVFKPRQCTKTKFAHEGALYFQDDWEINDKVKINAGYTIQPVSDKLGAYKIYTTDANGNHS